MKLDISTTIDRHAKYRYTFKRMGRNQYTGAMEEQTKRVTVYAKPWHDHKAQARALLPWGWVRSMVCQLEVLRV